MENMTSEKSEKRDLKRFFRVFQTYVLNLKPQLWFRHIDWQILLPQNHLVIDEYRCISTKGEMALVKGTNDEEHHSIDLNGLQLCS